jgi:hypothetical protein
MIKPVSKEVTKAINDDVNLEEDDYDEKLILN